ncbi:purine-nucleoside phosphorylase [Desulfuromonas carbonis]|uniref:purine-nucleoside phosphorylase n=1 Tax=Desulfuromonas sp. DDH964 TaxID=1823759 RepID=UPI00078BEA77|nr:purine-nucleoside phosphorylase [Desulfuromonas sp. DDH964]AMV71967.1 methylthioadenosine phosphorylase [Desulfuromonas sp. DDH964]
MSGEFAGLRQRVAGEVGPEPFSTAVILGSGLACGAEVGRTLGEIDYQELPGLPAAKVAGHGGRLVAAECWGERTLFFVGRSHLYEGYDARTVAAPVRAAQTLGCRRLLLTSAVGGIRAGLEPGDFLFVTDHLNLLGDNPLRGERLAPFIDLCSLYRRDLFPPLARRAADHAIDLHSGVLAACPGPSYETPAEVSMLGRLGADAVSMSTIPEAIMAAYLKMEVVALSLVSNHAAGRAAHPLNHAEVLSVGAASRSKFLLLLAILLELWHEAPVVSG